MERELRDLGERVGREVMYGAVPARRIVRRARLRRALALSVPTVAVLVVAAVTYPILGRVGRGTEGQLADLAAVARATEAAETARVELEVTMEIAGRPETIRGIGEIDLDRRRSYLRMEGTGPAGAVTGEMISIGRTSYQRPEGSEKWTRHEIEGGVFGAGAGPADAMTYLETISDEVTNLGREELDGVDVTHYRATIYRGAVRDFETISTDIEFTPMDVWVDELGRLRRLTFSTTIRDRSGTPSRMDMTMRLWDFGVRVDVATPDPEDVTDPLEAGEHSSGSSGATDDGSTTATYVTGRRGTAEPYVVVTGVEGDFDPPCVYAPGPVSRATIFDEAAREPFTTVTLRGSVGGREVGCASHHEGDDFEVLIRDPSRFTLRVVTDDGQTIVVRLEKTSDPVVGEVVTD